MGQVLEDIKAVRTLLSSPTVWTKQAIAKTDIGQVVDPVDPNACQFCMLGAVMKVTDRSVNTFAYSDSRDMDVIREVQKTLEQMGEPRRSDAFGHAQPSVVVFNDSAKTTHQDVMNVLDLTIQRLEAQQ